MAPMLDLLDDLEQRGLVHDTTDRAALAARLAEGPITLYYGVDPTAPSLHHGNLIGLIMLRRFQDAGHRPLALAGGATGMIGDPGGRSEERNLLDVETLAANVAAIKAQIARILGAEGARGRSSTTSPGPRDVRLLDFLRDVGKHVTVNQMVARESVKARMAGEHGISYTEFSYMLLQANDYGHLHQHRGLRAPDRRLGPVGQHPLGRRPDPAPPRRRRCTRCAGRCITAADGTKIGKTTGARVWLDPELTSPYAFFQHWINTDDAELRRMLAQFTLLPMAEVDGLLEEHAADPGAPTRPSGRWPRAVTELVHGPDGRRRRPSRPATCSSAPTPGRPRPTHWRRWRRRCPSHDAGARRVARPTASTSCPVLAAHGAGHLAGRRPAAARAAGLSVNGEKVAPGRRLGPDDLLARPLGAAAEGQEGLGGRWTPRPPS